MCLPSCGQANKATSNESVSEKNVHEHSFDNGTWEYDKEYHWHPSICGHDVQGSKSEHIFNKSEINPTFESDGLITYTCSICNYSYTEKGKDKLGHNYSSDWSYDENSHWHACTDEGYENLKTAEANHIFKETTIPASYESGGYTTYTCTVCNYSYTDSQTDVLPITITWENYDGTILEIDENVPYGSIPSYDGELPVKPGDGIYSYSFSTWMCDNKKGIKPAFEPCTYVASFSEEKNGVIVNIRYSLCDPKTNDIIKTYSSLPEEIGDISSTKAYDFNSNVNLHANLNEGYAFLGWYYDGTLISSYVNYNYVVWDKDITIEAKFCYMSYNLNIHTNNNENGLVLLKYTYTKTEYVTWYADSTTVFVYPTTKEVENTTNKDVYESKYDYKKEVKIAAFSKSAVRFLGWFDEKNNLVSTNAVYTFNMPNHDYTLEAKWNYFTVSYNLNGGTNNPANPTSYLVEDSQLALYSPIKTGYDFLGWQYKGNYVTEINPSWIENIELNAIWKAHDYSITYELNGGINDPSNPTNYTVEDNTITLKEPTRTGYAFDGWYDSPSFGDEIDKIIKGSSGDITLYAKWSIIAYTITYELNGGINDPLNPTNYTVEDSFVLNEPTKTGYTFTGWYDSENNEVTSILAGNTGALTLTAHWNEGNEYTITLDANGGQVSETLINVQYDHSYSLPNATRLGYTFDGWYDGSTKVNSDGTWQYTSNETFVAHWTTTDYSINYTLNGGTNNSSNPSSYTIEDTITFAAPSKTGYTFLGWFDGENTIASIPSGSIGTVNIEARWSADLHTLSVTSEDISKGTVTITSGSGYSDESITVVATPVEGYLFKGWYYNDVKVSINLTYIFTMPTKDYSLIARFWTKEEAYGLTPLLSEDGKTLTYGLYPQTNVNDSTLVSALNALTTPESNGWYLYNSDYYAKVSATPDGSGNKFDNGTSIVKGRTYWFKCEPITWNVLSNNDGEYYILSSVLLDAQCYYYNFTSTRTIDGKTIYPNNYKYSDIRTWLNNDFYNSAFALGNSYIQTTTVDNSAATTNFFPNKYACNNTQDKVFLPSLLDYTGFSTKDTRYCRTTDWARARGAACYTSSGSYQYCGYYWTRSPYGDSSERAWYVSYNGNLRYSYVDYESFSVRPAITIKIL